MQRLPLSKRTASGLRRMKTRDLDEEAVMQIVGVLSDGFGADCFVEFTLSAGTMVGPWFVSGDLILATLNLIS